MDLDLSDVFVRLLAPRRGRPLNRDLADKPIGIRTLGLVSLGAATVSVAGIQVQGMAENPDALSRVVQGIIQGVMAGISFIGGGRHPAQCADAQRRRPHYGGNLSGLPRPWASRAVSAPGGQSRLRSL